MKGGNCNCNSYTGGKRKILKKKLSRKHKGGNYTSNSYYDNLKTDLNNVKNKFSETMKNTDTKLGEFGNGISNKVNSLWLDLKNKTRKIMGGSISSTASPIQNVKTATPTSWLNADGEKNPPKWYGGKKTKRRNKKMNKKTKKNNNWLFCM